MTPCPSDPACSAGTRATDVNTTNNANGSASDTRQQVEYNNVSDKETRVTTGSITRMPQNSNNGAPAVVSDDMQSKLLDLSEDIGSNIEVNSGIRTAEQDISVGGSGAGQHVTGDSADIVAPGVTSENLSTAAHNSGNFETVSDYPVRGHVHVDQTQRRGARRRFTNTANGWQERDD